MAGKLDRSTDILDAVALLVVDMQTRMLPAVDRAEEIGARCGLAIEASRTLGLKVVFTEQVPDKLGPTDPRLRGLASGARSFAKDAFSALQAGGLPEYLKNHGIYHLLIAGIETSVCVYQTALHASDVEFDVTILSDCVSGRRSDDTKAVLASLAASNCHVLPVETVFYSMLGTSSHPKFRAFTEIVKRYSEPDPLAQSRKPAEAASEPSEFVAEEPSSSADLPAAEADPNKRTSRGRRGGRRRRRKDAPSGEAAAAEGSDNDTSTAAPTHKPATPEDAALDDSGPTEANGNAPKPRARRGRRGGARRRRSTKTAQSSETPAAAESVP